MYLMIRISGTVGLSECVRKTAVRIGTPFIGCVGYIIQEPSNQTDLGE